MKIETLVFDSLKKIIPQNAAKTVLFASVTETSYELFFYCLFEDGVFRQCYTLAEDGILDSYLLDMTFTKIAEQIRADKKYKSDSKNVFTFTVDERGVRLTVDYYSEEARTYKIKKDWKEKYII